MSKIYKSLNKAIMKGNKFKYCILVKIIDSNYWITESFSICTSANKGSNYRHFNYLFKEVFGDLKVFKF